MRAVIWINTSLLHMVRTTTTTTATTHQLNSWMPLQRSWRRAARLSSTSRRTGHSQEPCLLQQLGFELAVLAPSEWVENFADCVAPDTTRTYTAARSDSLPIQPNQIGLAAWVCVCPFPLLPLPGL